MQLCDELYSDCECHGSEHLGMPSVIFTVRVHLPPLGGKTIQPAFRGA